MSSLAELYDSARSLVIPRKGGEHFRVLVTGSRDWVDVPIPRAVLFGLGCAYGPLHVTHGAAKGLDKIANDIVAGMDYENWTKRGVPANWRPEGQRFRKGYDPNAGPTRNQVMVDLGHDVCLGFPLGASTGTYGCMTMAWRAMIPVYLVSIENTVTLWDPSTF